MGKETAEEALIRRYFDVFNAHDLDGVMACFGAEPVLVDSEGTRHEGTDAVRRLYADQFKMTPDGRCDLRSATGGSGHGAAESAFRGTTRGGRTIRAVGVEVFEFEEGRIKELRDYHRQVGPEPEAPPARGAHAPAGRQSADPEGSGKGGPSWPSN